MTTPEEVAGTGEYRFLRHAYWGEHRLVGPADKARYDVSLWDQKLGFKVLAEHEAEPGAREELAAGYSFFADNFSPGTIFDYSLESMRLKGEDRVEGYKKDDGTAIVLPTASGNALFVRSIKKNGLLFERLGVKNQSLIVGWTTESQGPKSAKRTLERLLYLSLYEKGSADWQAEEDRLLSSFRGRLLKLVQR